MRVSFSHNFFVNRVEIASVVFDLLRNGSRKSSETEEKEIKKPWMRSPAAHDRSISSSVLGLLVS